MKAEEAPEGIAWARVCTTQKRKQNVKMPTKATSEHTINYLTSSSKCWSNGWRSRGYRLPVTQWLKSLGIICSLKSNCVVNANAAQYTKQCSEVLSHTAFITCLNEPLRETVPKWNSQRPEISRVLQNVWFGLQQGSPRFSEWGPRCIFHTYLRGKNQISFKNEWNENEQISLGFIL